MSTASPIPMVNVQIDGTWLQFPKGTKVIEACSQAQKFVPRYCYHPKLSTPGNCRMCLVEIGMPKMSPDRQPVLGPDGKPEIAWIPRPQISCAQEVSEGMGVRTDSPMVRECRQGVMEFLLINHPLDCPICDQAGECRLQEFSVEYGQGQSRFLERKVKKPKNVELGPRVTLDAERCVLCSRCIRFMKEVAKDDVLGFVDRGSFSTIACHPERTLDSNYSLNTVDICPVGALTSTDFRFKMRVWFLKETRTIDVNDGLGCNITVGARENKVHRVTPRENNDVNGVWIPDSHRLNFKYLTDPERITEPQVKGQAVDWRSAVAIAADLIRSIPSSAAAVIASARMTNEELSLCKNLIQTLGAGDRHDVVPRIGEPDGILIPADRNPNTTGAVALGVAAPEPGSRLAAIAAGVRSGQIRLLVCFEDATLLGLTEAELSRCTIIATGILPNATTRQAAVLFPSSGSFEKRGSMINIQNRLQRLNRAVQAPGQCRDDWEILRDLAVALGSSQKPATLEEVFARIASEHAAFAGLNLGKIGDLGIPLAGISAASATATLS